MVSSARTSPELVVFGEFFLDMIFYRLPCAPRMGEEVKTTEFAEFPGGGLSTTALVAAGLGTATAIITRVGKDACGNPSWERLVGNGVDAGACEFCAELPTARTICAAYRGDRMMITHDTINRNLHALLMRAAARRKIQSARHLHLACAPWPFGTWTQAIRKMRPDGLTISLDIGWNPGILQSSGLPTLLRECEFIFPNELEARAMTGEKSVERAARKLAQWVRTPVVKLGRDGCIAVKDGRVVQVKSVRVQVADATGAGDAFNGGFLHGRLSGWSLEDCLRAGNVCGAMATTSAGGASAIPARKKLLEMMKRI